VDLARGGRSGAGGEMDKDDVGKKIKKKVKEKNKKKSKKGGHYGYSSFHPHYTVRRSRFAKRFLKMAPAPSEEPLHQRSRSQSRFGWSRSPPKRALIIIMEKFAPYIFPFNYFVFGAR
jgi:2'-5' RNA ligase